MNIKAFAPNSLTAMNLVCGVLGIIMALQAELVWSSVLIGIAAVFDFLDGFVARLLNVKSELGKQLDSLADAVTFGVLPGIMLFGFVSIGYGEYFVPLTERNHLLPELITLLVPVFAVLRLAKFNIDTRQTDSFIGMPTPAMAIFVAGLPLILSNYSINFYNPMDDRTFLIVAESMHFDWFDRWLVHLLQMPGFYIGCSIVLSALMVLPIPLLSLKFKSLKWRANKPRYAFLISVLVLIFLVFLPYILIEVAWWIRDMEEGVAREDRFRWPEWVQEIPFLDWSVVPLVILLYLTVSIINNLLPKRNEVQS